MAADKEPLMTTIRLTTLIPAPPEQVYDYVTRPARWKEWHPSSLSTATIGTESLGAGAVFEEDVRAGGLFRRHLHWRVLDSSPAQRWEATATMNDGSSLRLLYVLEPVAAGTRFTRSLDYDIRPPILRALNNLLLWRRVRHESQRALENLAQRFATSPR